MNESGSLCDNCDTYYLAKIFPPWRSSLEIVYITRCKDILDRIVLSSSSSTGLPEFLCFQTRPSPVALLTSKLHKANTKQDSLKCRRQFR